MVIKNYDIIAAWNEAEELYSSLKSSSDDDIISCKEILINRGKKIMEWLSKYVPEEDVRRL